MCIYTPHISQGKYRVARQEARSDATEAVALDPRYVKGHFRLAQCQRRLVRKRICVYQGGLYTNSYRILYTWQFLMCSYT